MLEMSAIKHSKSSRLENLLAVADARRKQSDLSLIQKRSYLKPKHFCCDCGSRLKTHGAARCPQCNGKFIGSRKRKSKEFS
jgi:hypothetical protein